MKQNIVSFTTLSIILDLLLIFSLACILYKLIEGSTAIKVIAGFMAMYLFYFFVGMLKLRWTKLILEQFVHLGPLVPIILFQREIRYFFFSIGKKFSSAPSALYGLFPWLDRKKAELDVTPIVKAVQILGGSNTGALIVFTKGADLRYYEETGDLINAVVSSRLLIAIFNRDSPLHDGAVIIHKNKIISARCVLPISDNPDISACFGLRHRAAIGLTETTDTLVLVVSEESGQVSIAKKGKMATNFSMQEVRSALKDYHQ